MRPDFETVPTPSQSNLVRRWFFCVVADNTANVVDKAQASMPVLREGTMAKQDKDAAQRSAHATDKPLIALPDKVYFRIGEVATLLQVEPHVVRFWQTQFGVVKTERSPTGRFLYPRATVERLQRIRALLYDQGYTIAGARKAMQSGGRAQAPVIATPTPTVALAVPSDDRRLAESQADVDRLRSEMRGLQARLAAMELSEIARTQAADRDLRDQRFALASALDDVTAMIVLLRAQAPAASENP